MTLEEFMKTDTYKNSDCIEYVGIDGMELPYDEDNLLGCDVIDYHTSRAGYLEIKINTI